MQEQIIDDAAFDPLVIIGAGNDLARFITFQTQEVGMPTLRLGLRNDNSDNDIDIELNVANDDHWLRLAGDSRLTGRRSFLYIAGIREPSVFLLGSGSSIRKHTEVNLIGLQNLFSFLARRENNWSKPASVVVVSSINSFIPVPGYGGYCATKAGAVMLCKVAAIELAPLYRVNLVAPGPFAASHVLAQPESRAIPPERHLLASRLTNFSDIWKVARFLLSSDSHWITGCELPVDGGLHLVAPIPGNR